MATSPAAMANQKGLGELWTRLKFLLLAIIVYRVGSHIPVPGIDPARLESIFNQTQNTIFGMANMFVFLLVTLFQWGTGMILDFFPSGTGNMPTLVGFQVAYAAVILVMGASFIRWRKVR